MRVARLTASVALVFVLVFVLAACGSGGPSASPTSVSAAPSTAASAAPSSPPSASPQAGQTDTEWGRIWDTLPPGFPTYPGGTPDESAGGGPASAVIAIDGLDAEDAATFLQTLLQKAGYTTVGSLDPLEDGSVVLEMTGPSEGCMLQATATKTGSLTTIRILYGAACPHG